jgi:hypothetical protein
LSIQELYKKHKMLSFFFSSKSPTTHMPKPNFTKETYKTNMPRTNRNISIRSRIGKYGISIFVEEKIIRIYFSMSNNKRQHRNPEAYFKSNSKNKTFPEREKKRAFSQWHNQHPKPKY